MSQSTSHMKSDMEKAKTIANSLISDYEKYCTPCEWTNPWKNIYNTPSFQYPDEVILLAKQFLKLAEATISRSCGGK